MSETTAKPEYCDHCGGKLFSVRILMPPLWKPVHQYCRDGYLAKQRIQTKTTANTSNGSYETWPK